MIERIAEHIENLDADEVLKSNLDLIIITIFVIIDWGTFRAIVHFTADSQLYNVIGAHYTTFSLEINLYELKKYSVMKSIIMYMAIFAIAKRLPRDG